MGYMQDFEAALRHKLEELDTSDEHAVADFIKWTKGEVLTSYKNGLNHRVEMAKAGKNVSRRSRPSRT